MAEPFKYEVCSHVWNYPRLAHYHLSAFLLHPPPDSMLVTVTIFYSREDLATVETLEYFRSLDWPENLKWRWWPLETAELCRRAIGRNLAAKATVSDWIHFSDIDYIYGPGALASLPSQLAAVAGPLAFPRLVARSLSEQHGDEQIDAVCEHRLYDLDYANVSHERIRRAVGGVQIVRGSVARERGYLADRPRWQRPADVWKRTHCDTAFRGWLGAGNGEPIEVENLYRVRHSKRGRFDVGVKL